MPPENTDLGSWTEWGRSVLASLEDGKARQESVDSRLRNIENKVTALNVKSGVWGAIGGMIPVFILLCFWLSKKG